MKKIIILTACMFIGYFTSAQKISKADIPAGIIKIYESRMIDSLPATWEKKDAGYIARFTKNDLKASMMITDKSEWVNTLWDLPSEYLPKRVKEYIATNYAGHKIIKTRIEYKPGGEFFLVSLKKKKSLPVLRFSVKSEFVRVEPAAAQQNVKDQPSKDKKTGEK